MHFPCRTRLLQHLNIRQQVNLRLYHQLRYKSSPAQFKVLLEAGKYSSGSCTFRQMLSPGTAPLTQSPGPEGTFFIIPPSPKLQKFPISCFSGLPGTWQLQAFETIIIHSNPCFTAWTVLHPPDSRGHISPLFLLKHPQVTNQHWAHICFREPSLSPQLATATCLAPLKHAASLIFFSIPDPGDSTPFTRPAVL